MTSLNDTTVILAPLRKGEIVEAKRSGDWCTLVFNTPISVNADGKSLLARIKVALDILRYGYSDLPQQKVMLVLHHTYASELNDLLIEGIYYTPEGEFKGERYTYQDSEADPAP